MKFVGGGMARWLGLDGVEMALLPDLRTVSAQHPRNGQHGQRHEPKQARSPRDAEPFIH